MDVNGHISEHLHMFATIRLNSFIVLFFIETVLQTSSLVCRSKTLFEIKIAVDELPIQEKKNGTMNTFYQ